jgi:hypothetical protein
MSLNGSEINIGKYLLGRGQIESRKQMNRDQSWD